MVGGWGVRVRQGDVVFGMDAVQRLYAKACLTSCVPISRAHEASVYVPLCALDLTSRQCTREAGAESPKACATFDAAWSNRRTQVTQRMTSGSALAVPGSAVARDHDERDFDLS